MPEREGNIIEKKIVGPDIFLVTVSLPSDVPLLFSAGQYVDLSMILKSGESGSRPFSIASAPTSTKLLEFIVKLTPGKLAPRFFQEADIGTILGISDPKDGPHLPERNEPIHFIAAGVGFAPFRSMILDLFERKWPAPIRLTLLRSEPWEALDQEFAEWYKKHGNFTYSLIHTSPAHLAHPNWEWRHLNFGLPEYHERIYISGSPEFVSVLRAALLARGFAKEYIMS